MKNKTMLITGATSGIGKAAAMELARYSETLVLAGRNKEKLLETINEIKAVHPTTQIDYLLCDFASLQSVRQMAAQFAVKYRVLDVLINNAGTVFTERTLTPDGYESTFAINHLAPFLLTGLLLEQLKASMSARVINVSSAIHHQAHINFSDLMGEQKYSVWKAYAQSKLANILFTYELAKHLRGSGITVNALHPGTVRTGIMNNFGKNITFLSKLFGMFFLTPQKGAQTTIYLATSSEVEGATGKYFVRKKAQETSVESYDAAISHRLWQLSEEFTKFKYPF